VREFQFPHQQKGVYGSVDMLDLKAYGRNTCLKNFLSNAPKVYYDYKYGLKLKLF